ncbi:hypothetical protein QSJ18_17525 [Gordonia sp. ABSL1-1]|uniref:DUF6611 family protein n=1 Tax=Gordonia sp. ABSL1-1 TaxID=3053923 RepID=UPI002572E033|nr:DUF6611 family protein [Gordonia sp. ABSL1-1]MDL9938549.1 hypothetical protein [Gordonia sp. ABSL1-1]
MTELSQPTPVVPVEQPSRRLTLARLTPPAPRFGHPLRGGDSWGFLRVGYARHWVQYRLAVYPPGTAVGQRLRLRVWHSAPIWAMAVWLVCWPLLATTGVAPVWSIGVAAVIALCAVLAAARAAGPLRRRVRWLVVWVDDDEDPAVAARVDRLLRIADDLRVADRDLAVGRIDPVAHETIWARAYDGLDMQD